MDDKRTKRAQARRDVRMDGSTGSRRRAGFDHDAYYRAERDPDTYREVEAAPTA